MITARVHIDYRDDEGFIVQLMTLPRIGESLAMPDRNGKEVDLVVDKVRHAIKAVKNYFGEQQLQQVEIIIFAETEAFRERQ